MRKSTIAVLTCVALSALSTYASAVQVSWYGPGFHGKRMANGERFNQNDPTTLAHKSLPFGTRVLLVNNDNGKTLCGVVRDRGPYHKNRSYDASMAGAVKLGFKNAGVAKNVTAKVGGC